MKYQEYQPHASLRDHVKCFWILEKKYSADAPDSAVNLELAKSKEDEALVGKQAGSFPFFGLGTDDCFGDYRRMKELGGDLPR